MNKGIDPNRWPLFPITIDEIYENQLDCLIINGSMLENFGPWEKDTRVCLTFDLISGEVTEFDDKGEIKIKKKLSPLKLVQ